MEIGADQGAKYADDRETLDEGEFVFGTDDGAFDALPKACLGCSAIAWTPDA